jgi:hypothetical protein
MSDDMSVVLGASSMIRTMADGTFRIQIDVEPRFAQQAFTLFGAPGTPVALARITNEAAIKQDRIVQRDTTAMGNNTAKGGVLARLAAQLCGDPSFWHFVEDQFDQCILDGAQCADWMREQCGIASRAELDSNEAAAEYFHTYIRKPWLGYQKKGGAS